MKVTRDVLETICAHAREGYPFEVCGMLLGNGAGVTAVVRVANRESEQPRVRYQIAPEDQLRVQRLADRAGQDLLGYYHSHPDHPARPSETDRRIAAEGLSDGVLHVVVCVAGGTETTPTAWVFRDRLQAFEPEPLDVVDRD